MAGHLTRTSRVPRGDCGRVRLDPGPRRQSYLAGLGLVLVLHVPHPALAGDATATGSDPLGDGDLLLGPLPIRDQFILGQGFLAFDAGKASPLARGEWRVDAVQSVTNTWLLSSAVKSFLGDRDPEELTLEELQSIEPSSEGEGIYFADGELYLTTLGISGGLGRHVEVSLSVPVVSFQGGFGDSLIGGFHDTFGLSQTGRDGVAEDLYTIYVRDADGNEVFRNRDPAGGLADIIASVKVGLPAPARWDFAADVNLKLPTGEEESLYSSGSADFGIQLQTARRFSRSSLHAAAGILGLGASETFHIDSQVLFGGLVGWEVLIGEWSLIAQVTASESPFEPLDIEKLDDLAFLIDIGFKKGFDNRMVVFGALTENFVNFGSSLDVGLHAGWSWNF